MRKPEYLSPTSLMLFESNREEFYRNYLAPCRPPRFPQTQPMSIGSAFDAYTKSYLYQALYGENHNPKYAFTALFESQVEPHNRDWAIVEGLHAFNMYKESGALADLMIEMQTGVDDPQFEIDVKGAVGGYREGISKTRMSVPLFGKPDIRFLSSEGANITYDWKVNGYCGNSNTSPMAGYLMLREQTESGWLRKGGHKNALPMRHKGITINNFGSLESFKEDWAVQLATYGWLAGAPVGADMVVGIEQLACNGAKRIKNKPTIRIASHRNRISEDYQFHVMARYQNLWSILTQPEDKFYFFEHLSFEESKLRCQQLDKQCELLTKQDGMDEDEKWMHNIGR